MAESKIHFKMFLGSPGDVNAEREEVRKIVTSFNHHQDGNTHFDVISWENFATPDFGRPQERIFHNTDFQSVSLFVAIFWSKLGTPTGAINPETRKEFASGTLEEIYHAQKLHAAGRIKRIMIYFNGSPVKAENHQEAQQYAELMAYKDMLVREKTGLFRTYKSLDDFRVVFREDLEVAAKELRAPRPASTYLTYAKPFKLGREAFMFCDRSNQVAVFKRFTRDNLRDKPGHPQFVFIHGHRKDGQISLLKRLALKHLGEIFEGHLGEEHAAIGGIHWVPFDYRGAFAEIKKNFIAGLFTAFDPAFKSPDLTAFHFCQMECFKKRPGVLIVHQIQATNSTEATVALIEWYIREFWGSVAGLKNIPQFFIYFVVFIPEPPLLGRFFRYLGIKARNPVDSFQRRWKPAASACPVLILPELNSVNMDEVESWFIENEVYASAQERKEEFLKKVFESPGSTKRMDEVEPHLRKICEDLG